MAGVKAKMFRLLGIDPQARAYVALVQPASAQKVPPNMLMLARKASAAIMVSSPDSTLAACFMLRTPVPGFPYFPLHLIVPFSASQRTVTSLVNSSEAYLTLASMLPTAPYVKYVNQLLFDSQDLWPRTSKSSALSFFIFHALPLSLITRAKSFSMICGFCTTKSCEKVALPVLQDGFHVMAFLICRTISVLKCSTFFLSSSGLSS